jgi:predicted ATPase/class 3 adenylate cyclase
VGAGVTFLLTDIEGSTRLWEERPEAMRRINARHDELVDRVVVAHDGSVVRARAEGDSAFATFDDPLDAVRGAIALQQAVHAEAWPDAIEVRVRMALHTGASLDEGHGLYGPVVNRCARLRGIGHGRQTLLSGATAALVADVLPADVSLLDLGVHRLKDLSQPEQVYQLAHPALARDFPPLRSLDAARHNLPEVKHNLIGQVGPRARIASLVDEAALVTLTGTGGIGKTRLAIAVAGSMLDRFAGGTWLVELATVGSNDLVEQAIATAVGARDQPGRPLLDTIGDHLRGKGALIVLDNCEHLLPDMTVVVEGLLRAATGTHILATSREPLGVPGEKVWRVDPMARADALSLFMARAGLSSVGAEDSTTIADICAVLDGIPLAVEMAAAACADGTALEDLRRGLSGVDSLRDTIAWSHKLLDDDERLLFRRIACFAGGFTLDAAERICAADSLGGLDAFDVLDLVARLVHQSLVVSDTSGARVRYRVLQPIREFASEALDEAMEREDARREHLRFFLALAEPVLSLQGDLRTAELDLLDLEHDNVLAALAWSGEGDEADLQVRLAGALGAFWFVRGFWTEGIHWLATVVDRTPRPWSGRALALSQLGVLAEAMQDFERAAEYYAETDDVYAYLTTIVKDLTIKGQIESSRIWLMLRRAELARVAGDTVAAERAFVDAGEIAERHGFQREVGTVHAELGALAIARCDWATARTELGAALHAFRSLGDGSSAAAVLCSIASVSRLVGEDAAAAGFYREALALAESASDPHAIAQATLGVLECRLAAGDDCAGDLATAQALLATARERGDVSVEYQALDVIGQILRSLGDAAGAVDAHADTLRRLEESAPGVVVTWALRELARSFLAAGRREDARDSLERAAVIAASLPDPRFADQVAADLSAL